MRWCFWMQMEDRGRMHERIMQTAARTQTEIVTLSSTRLDRHVFMSGIVECEDWNASRFQSLSRGLNGMRSVEMQPESTVEERVIALFRIRCDMNDRSEVLQLISAIRARVLVVRPLWITFEVVGSFAEVEGIYQSACSYGFIDLVSFSCVHMPKGDSTPLSAAHDVCELGEERSFNVLVSPI